MAAVRLAESTALPGLAAIEVVILGLPWSLALGIDPLSRLGWPGMVVITVLGVALNALLLWKIIRVFELRRRTDS
ncbi:MAG TPA: hypothetical protein VIM04_12250 [Candidatus Binatia bacterium]